MAALIITFLLFYLPLVVFPFGRLTYEPPKVFIAEVLIILLFVVTILKRGFSDFRLRNKFLIVTLIGLLLLPLASLTSDSFQKVFFGNIFRLQGVLMLWLLILFSVIGGKFEFGRRTGIFAFVSLIFLFASSLVLGSNSSGRAIGTFGEPNAFASTSVYIFLFSFYLGDKYLKIASLFLLAPILYLANSQSALLALILGFLVLYLPKLFKERLIIMSIAASLILIASLTLPFFDDTFNLSGASPSPFKFEERSDIWKTSFQAGLEKPILGWGFGSLQEVIQKTSSRLNYDIQYQVIDSSHNALLDYWVQGGIIGVLLFLFITIMAILRFCKTGQKLELSLLFALLTAMFFNPVSITVLVAFWFILGRSFEKKNTL